MHLLTQAQKDELNPDMIEAEKRFKTALYLADIKMIGEKYVFEVMKAFVPHKELNEKTYSIRSESTELRAKYPLLFQSNFSKYTPEVINHLLTYIKLCDSQQF
jgi:hypothetical protein